MATLGEDNPGIQETHRVYSWESMEIHGRIHGNSWKNHGNGIGGFQGFMEIHGEFMETNSWKFMEIHGNPWDSWKIHGKIHGKFMGSSWKFMGKTMGNHGNSWNSWKVHGKIHGKSMEIHGKSLENSW